MHPRKARILFHCVVAAVLTVAVCVVMARRPVASKRKVLTADMAVPTVSAEPAGIVLHARNAERIEKPFIRQEDATAAEGMAVAVPPKAGAAPGAVLLPFTLGQDGTHSIWVRVYWGTDGEGACSDSLSVSLDGKAPRTLQDATHEAWHWIPLSGDQGIELAAGDHSLLFTNREDGIKFDQVFITPWSDDESARRVPQGIE